MPSELDELRRQSEEHPLVPTTGFHSLEEYVLYLSHRFAYEEAAKLAVDKTVLDVGCNNGYGTIVAGAHSKLTIGVDVSPTAVEFAQAFNSRENVRYQTIDGLGLPFDSETFDLAISFEVIEHVSDAGRYLDEIRRVLKRGGAALLTTPNARMRLDPGMKPWNEFHVREYLSAELFALLKQSFMNVEIRGLFARPVLYDIELERVQRAKIEAIQKRAMQKRATYKASRLLIEAAKSVLPAAAADTLRRAVKGRPSTTPVPLLDDETLQRYSTADFFYRTGGLDAALDFMAVCS